MAIVQEHFYIGEREFVRTYSDEHRFVVREGIEYDVAEDPAEFGRTYTEGDLNPYWTEGLEAEELLSIILGGEV